MNFDASRAIEVIADTESRLQKVVELEVASWLPFIAAAKELLKQCTRAGEYGVVPGKCFYSGPMAQFHDFGFGDVVCNLVLYPNAVCINIVGKRNIKKQHEVKVCLDIVYDPVGVKADYTYEPLFYQVYEMMNEALEEYAHQAEIAIQTKKMMFF